MENILIFLGLVILIALPIIIGRQVQKKKVRQKIEEVSAVARQNGSALGQHEIEYKILIGLSEDGSRVYYYPFKHKDKTIETIPLEGIKNCKVNIEGHAANYGGESRQVTDKIELLFMPREKLGQPLSLRLYDSDQDGLQLTGQQALSERWAGFINQALTKNPKSMAV